MEAIRVYLNQHFTNTFFEEEAKRHGLNKTLVKEFLAKLKLDD